MHWLMMTAKNDITGDPIKSKSATDAYRSNFDAIFGGKSNRQNSLKLEHEKTPSTISQSNHASTAASTEKA